MSLPRPSRRCQTSTHATTTHPSTPPTHERPRTRTHARTLAGTDFAANKRKQRAASAGAIEAAVAAMRAHPHESGVQEGGCAHRAVAKESYCKPREWA